MEAKVKAQNIIALIGMTGVGKTTIGQRMAGDEKANFYDLDKIIEEREEKKIRDIFDEYGENEFRKRETYYLKEIISEINSDEKNTISILSCGGGIVTSEENIKILKDNTIIIWIKRRICDIMKDKDVLMRPPINNNIENYKKIYEKRKHLYEKTADFAVDNFDNIENLRLKLKFFRGTEKTNV